MNPHPVPRTPRHVPAVALLLSLVIFVTGCTSLHTTAVPGAPGQVSAIRPGDAVQVQTKAGQTSSFKVTAVESDALTGTGVRIKYDDMAGLQVRRPDMMKTGLLVVLVAASAVVVAGMVTPIHFGPFFPPGTTF